MNGPDLLPTLINGRWMLLLPEHRAARPQWQTGWEVERLASMHSNIKPGDVVFDIGTEEGDMSALFAMWAAQCIYCGKGWFEYTTAEHWYKPKGWCSVCGQENGTRGGICLFEPNERVWPNVRAIFEGNDVPQPLAWYIGFAGHEDHNWEDGIATDSWPTCAYGPIIGDHGFSNLCERPDIPSIRLDTFVEQTGHVPNVITMDVEGSELHVLEGAHATLLNHQPLVYVSVHRDFMWDMYGHSIDDLLRFMRDAGYSEFLLGVDHEEHYAFVPRGRTLKEAE